MNKSFTCIIVIALLAGSGLQASAQNFQWPRENAFEMAGGVSGNGFSIHAGYVHFVQPKKPQEKPFKKKYKSLLGRNKYEAFPCKKKPVYKIPPGISLKTSLIYELGSGKGIRYQIIGMDAAVLYVIHYNKYLFISLKGGITGSHNSLIPKDGNRTNKFSQLKYGVLGGLEVERMIDDWQSTSLVVGWHQQYLENSGNWGNKRWNAFLGVRFRI